jgi:hypothetical protein
MVLFRLPPVFAAANAMFIASGSLRKIDRNDRTLDSIAKWKGPARSDWPSLIYVAS